MAARPPSSRAAAPDTSFETFLMKLTYPLRVALDEKRPLAKNANNQLIEEIRTLFRRVFPTIIAPRGASYRSAKTEAERNVIFDAVMDELAREGLPPATYSIASGLVVPMLYFGSECSDKETLIRVFKRILDSYRENNQAFFEMTDSAPSCSCSFCGNPNAQNLCGKCLKACYCDTTCQRNDWPRHKPVCVQHAAEAINRRNTRRRNTRRRKSRRGRGTRKRSA